MGATVITWSGSLRSHASWRDHASLPVDEAQRRVSPDPVIKVLLDQRKKATASLGSLFRVDNRASFRPLVEIGKGRRSTKIKCEGGSPRCQSRKRPFPRSVGDALSPPVWSAKRRSQQRLPDLFDTEQFNYRHLEFGDVFLVFDGTGP